MNERIEWANLADLATRLEDRALLGRRSVLSPETAKLIARALLRMPSNAPPPPDPDARFRVDMASQGSTVYRLDSRDEILEIVAWAQSSAIARCAHQELVKRYENDRFMQKRRAWVEEEPPPRTTPAKREGE